MSVAESTASNRFQEQFGAPLDRTRAKIGNYLSEYTQAFIQQSSFAVLATSDGEGR